MSSLKNTHLYGRHLVLEWANEDTEEDQLGSNEQNPYMIGIYHIFYR